MERIDDFLAIYPDKAPVDVLSMDTIFRIPTVEFIKERCKSPESKTYSYQFTYEFPMFEGKVAWHCSEIPFVFHNIDNIAFCHFRSAIIFLTYMISNNFNFYFCGNRGNCKFSLNLFNGIIICIEFSFNRCKSNCVWFWTVGYICNAADCFDICYFTIYEATSSYCYI